VQAEELWCEQSAEIVNTEFLILCTQLHRSAPDKPFENLQMKRRACRVAKQGLMRPKGLARAALAVELFLVSNYAGFVSYDK